MQKIIDGNSEDDNSLLQKLSVSSVYETINRSNSILSRKSKPLLEKSIEKVLHVRRQDAQKYLSSDEMRAQSVDSTIADTAAGSESGYNMNREMVKRWKPKITGEVNGAASTATPPATDNTSKKRKSEIEIDGKPQPKKGGGAPKKDRSPPTHINLRDLGGVGHVIQQLRDLIVLPLLTPQLYLKSKIQPPRGILLYGPPGCGKTMIANAFAAALGVSFVALSAPSIVSGMSGESEKTLRDHFDEAQSLAPCLMFMDEIDAITPKRDSAQREMEKRIVAQLLTCMDDLALEKTGGKAVIVLAATNRPDSLDPALRRGGRFDKEINLGVPNENVREQILRTLTREMPLEEGLDFPRLAKATPGFVGADLNDLVSTAGSASIKRHQAALENESNDMQIDSPDDPSTDPEILKTERLISWAKETPPTDETLTLSITNADFSTALPQIQPSALREGFATIPDTTFADIGALRPVRDELQTWIVDPIKHPEKYAAVGITRPSGVLLWGPPGCGKTLLAKAVANESKANFISVKGPELLNKYVGESERAVRQVFTRARSSVPCVILFDELDALVPKRDGSVAEASARVVNTLLAELDGMGHRQGIYIIAATNRPEMIDDAILRSGRLETLIYVGLPQKVERVEILATLMRNLNRTSLSEEMVEVARKCERYSGADLEKLLRQAGIFALQRDDNRIIVEDLENAKKKVKPTVKADKYKKLLEQWGTGTKQEITEQGGTEQDLTTKRGKY